MSEERLATSSAGSVQYDDWVRSVFVRGGSFVTTFAAKSVGAVRWRNRAK